MYSKNRRTDIPLDRRYDAFCADAEELLKEAGLADSTQQPQIIGKAFLEACNSLASIHFPDDTEVGGIGPRGLIWGMYGAVGGRSKEAEIAGARAVANTLKKIIQHRPAIQPDLEELSKLNQDSIGGTCPFFESGRRYGLREDLIFVLMPFNTPWSERLWMQHIREYLSPAQLGFPMKVLRADDLFGQAVMEDVWEGIVNARLVIADCTGRNPNVLYELGLAHAIGKRTALLSQREEDIPFDLRRFRFCIYEDNSSGYPKLRQFLHETFRDALPR